MRRINARCIASGISFALASFLCVLLTLPGLAAKSNWQDSPLSVEAQSSLDKAGRLMKSGKHDKAKPAILAVLETANDVPKCLAIARYTESYAYPMMEVRRQCLNKALSLCQTEDDFILLALKARKYQFYEITRQAMHSLIENAKTVSALYDVSHKAQEVALNDLSHLAMEKAYTGLKTEDEAFTFADHCQAIGMDDLMRKALKQVINDEDESGELCNMALKIEKYNMRDLNRYLMRKALDNCKTVPDMEAIAEVARRLNEPDVMARAQYYVKKGKLIQKFRDNRASYDNKVRAEQESNQAAEPKPEQAGFGSSNPQGTNSPPVGDSKASSGY